MFSFQGAVLIIHNYKLQITNYKFEFPFPRDSMKPQISLRLQSIPLKDEVVGQNGLEPSTSRLSVVCSSQLSYWPISASLLLVEISGIEPLTSCLQGRRSPSWAKPPYSFSGSLGTFSSVPSKLNNASINFFNPCTDLRTLLVDALLY